MSLLVALMEPAAVLLGPTPLPCLMLCKNNKQKIMKLLAVTELSFLKSIQFLQVLIEIHHMPMFISNNMLWRYNITPALYNWCTHTHTSGCLPDLNVHHKCLFVWSQDSSQQNFNMLSNHSNQIRTHQQGYLARYSLPVAIFCNIFLVCMLRLRSVHVWMLT